MNWFNLRKTVLSCKSSWEQNFSGKSGWVMINPCLLEELCVPRTHLFVAKDVASPSDVLEQHEDLDNARSRCKHPLSNKGLPGEKKEFCWRSTGGVWNRLRWSWFLRGVTTVCVTLEQILLSYKLLKSHVRVENLIKCLAVCVLVFFWSGFLGVVAGRSEQRWSQFLFLGGEECTWQGCSPCGGCRWGASCL